MYTKQEISRQKQAFWTAFGRYMKPVLSADAEEINWINYKTRNKYISFKMDVDRTQTYIAIIVHHPDAETQQALFDRLLKLKDVFYETLEEDDWTWEPETTDEHGKLVGVIEKSLSGVNIFNNEDWPAIISFLKPRIIALDAFWSMVRYQMAGL